MVQGSYNIQTPEPSKLNKDILLLFDITITEIFERE